MGDVYFRTVNLRSGKGASECSLPSCRAGCTADLFQCVFVDVEYTYRQETDNRTRIDDIFNTTTEEITKSKSMTM